MSSKPKEPPYRSYSYGYLLLAMHKAQGRISEEPIAGRAFADCLSALLFSAFAFEAFVNHVGEESFEHWEPIKMKLSACDKLDLIAEKHGVAIDWSGQPYQSLKMVMGFRNLVVHAETKDVPVDIISGATGAHKSHWPSYCDRTTALRISEDIEKIIDTFPNEIGLKMPRKSVLTEEREE